MFALVLALAVGEPKVIFETEEAQAAYDEAGEAYKSDDYERAADALGRAYALEPHPKLLYAQAQAERMAGRCAQASPLYIAFLDTQPAEELDELAALARWNLSLCLATMPLDAGACEQAETQLRAIRADAEGDPTKSKELLQLEVRLGACRAPEPAPLPAPVVEPEPTPPPPVVEEPAPTRARRRVDPWGVGLGAGSLVMAGGSVGLFLAGQAQSDAVSLEGTHGRARTRYTTGRTMTAGGVAAAATAGGLAVGAVVHWLVWRKRQN